MAQTKQVSTHFMCIMYLWNTDPWGKIVLQATFWMHQGKSAFRAQSCSFPLTTGCQTLPNVNEQCNLCRKETYAGYS